MRDEVDLHRQAELFLYREAKLLDEGEFDQWLDLFTEDARYWLPITESLEAGKECAPQPGDWSLMEEDRGFLAKRRDRLAGRLAHSEQPRSRTRRFISNVLVTSQGATSLTVECNFMVFQSRRSDSEHTFVGRRKDEIAITELGWRIAERFIVLDHRVLPRALSIYF